MDKTEFEKLCVLFFRAEINNHMFVESTTFEEGVYGIGYSLYGPRVSNGKLIYDVSANSAIVTDFYENGLVKIQNGKYYIAHDVTIDNFDIDIDCGTFASDFSELAKAYADSLDKKENKISNQYVHTYNQFLTLLAINLSPKNQILSLCAELYQFLKLKEDIFYEPIENIPLGTYKKILSGIGSGLWKYRCFKNDAYIKTTKRIQKIYGDNAIRGIPRVKVIPDENKALYDMLDKCGELLYQIAYLLNEVLSVKDRSRFIKSGNMKYSEDNSKGSINDSICLFNKADYFYEKFKSDRKSIKDFAVRNRDCEDFDRKINLCFTILKKRAQQILDWCDLYLGKNNPEYKLIQQFWIVVSRQYDLPCNLFGRNNMNLQHITDLERIAVFPVFNAGDFDTILNKLFNSISQVKDVDFILFDVKNTSDSLVQIGNCAKASCLEKTIKSVISMVSNEPVSEIRRLYYVSSHKNKEIPVLEHYEVNKYDNIIFEQEYCITKHTLRRREQMKEITNNISVCGNVENLVTGKFEGILNNKSQVLDNVDDANLEEQIKKLLNEIREAGLRLSNDQKEEMEDYMETIQEMVQQDNPKNGMLRTAFKGLKDICTDSKFLDAVSKLAPVIQKMITGE